MIDPYLARAALLALAFSIGSVAAQNTSAQDWPQFRGPAASGVGEGGALPTTFDTPSWRTPVPGLAHASPIVLDGRIFIATAVVDGDDPELRVGLYGAGDSADDLVETEFRLLALDAKSGAVLWDTLASKGVPNFGRHTKATQVNCTPAASGGAVVAVLGSELVCIDTASGDIRWRVHLGPLDCGPHDASDLHWGYASSPIITGEFAIVQADVKGKPYLAAFALDSGDQAWRIARDDVNTWCTPTAFTQGTSTHILVNGCKHMGAYDLADGAEVWRMAGSGGIPVPTPVVADGLAYFTANHRPLVAAHPLKPVYAVRLAATGDLGTPNLDTDGTLNKDLAWMVTRRGNYMQTPVVYDGMLFLGSDNGIVTCLDAATGTEHYRERLDTSGDGFTASPVAGDGKVYWVSEQGNVVVVAAKPEFEVLARGELGEICMSTPAISNGGILFRLRHSVVRFQ